MARWRLTSPHYLNVPGVTWEYSEIDRTTNRPIKRSFPVPTLLNPDEPSDWNHRYGQDQGEIIVAHEGKTDNARDIIFVGPPTPDMVPLDDEAKAISAKYASVWKHPIESLPNRFSDVLLNELETEVAKVRGGNTQVEGMSELMAAMATLMKQNAELLATLVGKESAPQQVARRA